MRRFFDEPNVVNLAPLRWRCQYRVLAPREIWVDLVVMCCLDTAHSDASSLRLSKASFSSKSKA